MATASRDWTGATLAGGRYVVAAKLEEVATGTVYRGRDRDRDAPRRKDREDVAGGGLDADVAEDGRDRLGDHAGRDQHHQRLRVVDAAVGVEEEGRAGHAARSPRATRPQKSA